MNEQTKSRDPSENLIVVKQENTTKYNLNACFILLISHLLVIYTNKTNKQANKQTNKQSNRTAILACFQLIIARRISREFQEEFQRRDKEREQDRLRENLHYKRTAL